MSGGEGSAVTEASDPIRGEAVKAFNRTWALIESPDRSPAEDDEMLEAAFASRHLWDAIGGEEQRAVGDWQIAHVASLLGYADLALSRSDRALGRALRNGWTDWRLASCYEGMARANDTAGNGAQRDHWAALAREVLDGLEDDEDRDLISSQLASIPGILAKDVSAGASHPPYRVTRLDHVQVAMPDGREKEAEAFYGGILGLEVRPKPPALAVRGGRWFEDGVVKVHLGIESDFRAAEKAHIALVVEGLEAMAEVLGGAGHPVRWDTELPEVRRCYTADPFGNRIELIQA